MLAEYDFEYRVPPLVYNSVRQEIGGMLDQHVVRGTLPEDYKDKLDRLKSQGIKHVVLHDNWQRSYGIWQPSDPDLYWCTVRCAQAAGFKVLAYWNPTVIELPHDIDDDVLFTWPGRGPDWGESQRMVDMGRPVGAAMVKESLRRWLETNHSLDGIYIDLFWAWGDRRTGMIAHSFPQVERLSRWCTEQLRAWKEDFVLMFNARYYGPPSMFECGIPLFGEWTSVEDEVVDSGGFLAALICGRSWVWGMMRRGWCARPSRTIICAGTETI